MSNILSNERDKLRDFVGEIKQNVFLIPNFQRDFVWKRSDIEELGNSIVNEFPISNILIMATDGSLDLESKDINVSFDLKNNRTKEQYYVLDGQQRITAIAEIFISGDYYFDLAKLLFDLDNQLTFAEPKYLNKADLNKIEDFNSCCLYLKTNKLNEIPENNRFLACNTIIDISFLPKVLSFLDQFKNSENYNIYLSYLNNIINAVNNYQILKLKIDKQTPLEKIILIFEKVNSTGKDLNISDLLEAKSCKSNKNGIGFKEKVLMDLKNILIANNDLKHFFDYILNISIYNEKESLKDISLFVRLCELNKVVSKDYKFHFISKGFLLKSNSEDWFLFWDESREFFVDYILWLQKEHIQNIVNKKIFEFLFIILLKNKHLFNNENYMKELKKFIYYYNFESTNTNNGKLFSKLELFCNFTYTYNENKLEETFFNLSRLNSTYIKKIELNNKPDINQILNILIYETDYLNFSLFRTSLREDKKPLKLFDKKEFANLFINQIYINKEDSLKTDSFITIIQNIENRLSDTELESRLKNNFLSKDIEDISSFEEENLYLTKRAELIFKAIENYFQS